MTSQHCRPEVCSSYSMEMQRFTPLLQKSPHSFRWIEGKITKRITVAVSGSPSTEISVTLQSWFWSFYQPEFYKINAFI